MFGRPVREYCGSPLSAVGDALYFCTNLGAVASMRATDGQWRWLFRYPPNEKAKSVSFETVKVPPAWALSPVVATPERIVVAPTDCDFFYGLDPDSGTCIGPSKGKSKGKSGGGIRGKGYRGPAIHGSTGPSICSACPAGRSSSTAMR